MDRLDTNAFMNDDHKNSSNNNEKREPILGISIYDERNLKKKCGRKFQKLDKFINYKIEHSLEDENQVSDKPQYEYSCREISDPCVWRDKVNITFDMDIVQIMEELWKCFISMDGFDIDPDQKNKLLEESDSYCLKKSVDRALKWLLNKIYEAKLDPIIITLDNPGDQNNEIVEALTDPRSASDLKSVTESVQYKKDQIYFTPHFLKHFDFDNSLDRHYLKNKVRFMSI